ncbi:MULTISPECIES: hypothetical protein [Saccharothrix]|uniref:hypothetical protein n=1 Tax=Saccharothrix TaxID=2071 RepID=UPI00095B111F|nr:hypothetical protein [Saccharothrix sp. CB00851]OKI36239.1 hypothetical protein A6A25_22915 [Saccharothrix sp. CB00851]
MVVGARPISFSRSGRTWVEYSLTPLGTHAAKQISELFGWIEENLPNFLAAQQKYDARRAESA